MDSVVRSWATASAVLLWCTAGALVLQPTSQRGRVLGGLCTVGAWGATLGLCLVALWRC
jgi:hypothetical protein